MRRWNKTCARARAVHRALRFIREIQVKSRSFNIRLARKLTREMFDEIYFYLRQILERSAQQQDRVNIKLSQNWRDSAVNI